jgi:transcriptional/translational regulatory protein YebC/TACO1
MDALEAGAEDSPPKTRSMSSPPARKTFTSSAPVSKQKITNLWMFRWARVPVTWTELSDPELAEKMENMIEKLEELDDVQEVYHNWDR